MLDDMNSPGSDRMKAKHETRTLVASLLEQFSVGATDARHRPPDMLGHLADRQVYRADLERMAKYVRENWPQVTSIRCGRRFGEPYFVIEIDSYSEETRVGHWPLTDWIRDTFPKTSDFSFFIQGPIPGERISSAMAIYPRIVTPCDYPAKAA